MDIIFNDGIKMPDGSDMFSSSDLDPCGKWRGPEQALCIEFDRTGDFNLNDAIAHYYPGLKYLSLRCNNYLLRYSLKELPSSVTHLVLRPGYQGEGISLAGLNTTNVRHLLLEYHLFTDTDTELPACLREVLIGTQYSAVPLQLEALQSWNCKYIRKYGNHYYEEDIVRSASKQCTHIHLYTWPAAAPP